MKHSITPIQEGEGGPRAHLNLITEAPEEQKALKALIAAIGDNCRERIIAGYATDGSMLTLSIAVTSIDPLVGLRSSQTPAA